MEESNMGFFSMREIPRSQFTHLCWCWKHTLFVVQQLAQVVTNSYLFPVSQTHLSWQLLTCPVNRAYLRVKLGHLFFIKVELFVHSFLVSKLREGKKKNKSKTSYFA